VGLYNADGGSRISQSLPCDFAQFHSNHTVDRVLAPQQTAGLMLRVTIFALLLASTGCDKAPESAAAAPPSTETKRTESPSTGQVNEKTFGPGVTLAESVAIDKIVAEPAAFRDKTVRVEGMVTDVCPKRGCWFEMAGDAPGSKLRFKVVDGEMVFPLDSKGKYAVAEGKVKVTELSVEDSKKYAEYQAKEYGKPYDPASITKPTLVVRLDGTGAVFRDKK
jgi:hypothetical protein